jgi:acyl-CoA thioesterase-1
MKKAFKYFVVCGLLIFLGGCGPRQIINADSKGKNIICFGDSITAGYGVDPGQDYPSQLGKLVSVPVINSGNSGDTSAQALKRLESDVLDKEPLLVIVEFGGNDFLKKLPIEEAVKNIEEMIKKAQSAGAMVALADISNSIIMSGYRKELESLSNKHKAIFIPKLLNGILTTPSLKSDFIHPNASGYKLIAQRIHQAIAQYIDRRKSR